MFSLDKTNNRPSAPLDLTMKCKHTRNEENALDLSANVVRNLSCVGPMEDNSVFSPQKQATPHPNKGTAALSKFFNRFKHERSYLETFLATCKSVILSVLH